MAAMHVRAFVLCVLPKCLLLLPLVSPVQGENPTLDEASSRAIWDDKAVHLNCLFYEACCPCESHIVTH